MHVHIKISDRGWILEKMAQELAARLNYATFDTDANADADIQYYLTYSARLDRISPLELAYFTHVESEPGANKKFFDVAKAVDYCVCQSGVARDALLSAGISALTIVPPGVDLERFRPLVRVGVIGRTYHTGRKGEHLVNQVMDVPGIEWLFTGPGWPGPSSPVPDDELPDFYRTLDYVLVPALNEGGPMCVLEALACGVPVIAPPIGWVPEFPHIEFRTGDASDLRRVLSSIVKERQDMHATVREYSWTNFASAHDKLFQQLRSRLPARATPARAFPSNRKEEVSGKALRAILMTHGGERQAKGGPSVRIPMTVDGLRQQGVDAKMRVFPDADLAKADVVHLFNIWQPETALGAMTAAKRLGLPTVFSPIYLDLSARPLWNQHVPRAFREASSHAALKDRLALIREQVSALGNIDPFDLPEPTPGFYARLWELVEASDHVIFLSETERARLCRVLGQPIAGTVVRNFAPPMNRADPSRFAERFGVRDYVLCIGRLEARKNQLMLAYALKESGLPVVLIGHAGDSKYMEDIKRLEVPNLRVIDRLPPGSDLLASAYAGARLFALPSWAEGAPLAALEAARLGIPLVLSDRSGEREYFGDFARYCDPSDPEQIAEQVLAAYSSPHDEARRNTQASHFEQTYTLDRHCAETVAVYREVCEKRGEMPALASVGTAAETIRATRQAGPKRPHITLDLTSTAHVREHLTGITRVEQKLADFLKGEPRAEISFCAWRPADRIFVNVSRDATSPEDVKKLFKEAHPARSTPEPGGEFLLAGGAWMQNPVYAQEVVDFCRAYDQTLNVLIYDLIPVEFPFWARPGYTGIFEESLQIVLANASRIMAISKTTQESLAAHCAGVLGYTPEITVIRLGDDLSELPNGSSAPAAGSPARFAPLLPSLTNFALCVGAIHARKNYQLLYTAWLKLVEDLRSAAPHLVIVGGTQIGGDELRRTFQEDKRINQHVHLIDDADDEQLADLYRRCAFTLYPSLCEGWGLPVAESLNYGKICLASDIPSIREFVPDDRDLLDPSDIKSWIARIRMYATSRTARTTRETEIKSRYQQKSWRDTSSQVVDCITHRPVTARTPPQIYAGELVPLTQLRFAKPLVDVASAPACTTDTRGITGSEVAMHFRPIVRGDGGFQFFLNCRCDRPEGGKWTLTVNGGHGVDLTFANDQIVTVTGSIPRSSGEKNATTKIQIAPDRTNIATGVANGSEPPRIEISYFSLTERPATQSELPATLSRRAHVWATLSRAAVSKPAASKPSLKLKKAKKKRGAWKRFKRFLRKGAEATGGVVRRTLPWRIKIKLVKAPLQHKP